MQIVGEPNEESTHASCLSSIAFVLRVVDRETEPKGFHGNLFEVKGRRRVKGEKRGENEARTCLIPSSLVYWHRKTSPKPPASQYWSPGRTILSDRSGMDVDERGGRPGSDLAFKLQGQPLAD